jgi:hypothetical protein
MRDELGAGEARHAPLGEHVEDVKACEDLLEGVVRRGDQL